MTLLPVHITAGAIGLITGAVALYALKGGALHRRSGMIFVYAMLAMSASGAAIAVVNTNRGNVLGGGLAFYLVTTALFTTRRRAAGVAWMDLAATLLGLAVAVAGFTFGLMAFRSAAGNLDGYPPPLYFVFGTIALLSVAGDARAMLARGLEGRRRVVRHLWRMCFAMFIATGSFFLGQAKVFPKPIRIMPLLATLALLPLVLMLYWLARASFTKRYPRRA
jgi:uncharacterized membrane protein